MRPPIYLREGLLATLCLAAMMFAASNAAATVINFDSHASTTSTSGVPPAAAVVTTDFASLGIVFGRAGFSAGSAVVNSPPDAFSPPNGACGLDAAGVIVSICTGDQYFEFVKPSDGITPASTNLLSFVVGDSGGDADSWLLHVYNSANIELEARPVVSVSKTLQSFAFADMHRVWIQWTDGPFGYLLDDVTFNEPTSNSVPEPSSWLLMMTGAAWLVRRRAVRR